MIAQRAADMTSFIVMDVLEKAHEMERNGIDVIHLEVGEPDFDTPPMRQGSRGQSINGRPHPLHPQSRHDRAAGSHLRILWRQLWGKNFPGPGDCHLGHVTSHVHAVCRHPGRKGRGDHFRSPLCLLSQFHQIFKRRSGHRAGG